MRISIIAPILNPGVYGITRMIKSFICQDYEDKELIIIDGGFCKAYHKETGIAGYTLIYNSHGMRLNAHKPFESIRKVLEENKDIESSTDIFETEEKRIRVRDTDIGKSIQEQIEDLKMISFDKN